VRRLVILAALALGIPLILVAAIGSWRAVSGEAARFEAQMQATTRAMAGAVDREIAQARLLVEVLAASTALREGHFLLFDTLARSGVPEPYGVTLRAADGRYRINTRVEPDERVLAALPSDNPELVARSIAAGRTTISGMLTDPAGRRIVAVGRRVEVNGDQLLLSVVMPTARFRDVLTAQRMPEGWVASVLDARGIVVARTRAEEEFIGRAATAPVMALLSEGDEGILRAITTHDGMRSVAALTRAEPSGFSVVMAAPLATPWRQFRDAVGPTAIWGGVLLLLGVALASAFAGRLLRAVDALAAGRGGASGLRELDEAAQRLAALNEAQNRAMDALRESEARHRVTLEAFAGGVYECHPMEGRVLRSRGHLELVGEAQDDPGRDRWLSRIHPADRPAMDRALADILAGLRDRFELEYRVRHADGHWVWVWHRSIAQRDAQGRTLRLNGSVIDVTAEHAAREAEAAVARELDHRVKNNFALVSSIVGLAAANHPEARAFAAELRERLRSLTSAHDLLRQGAEAEGTSLHGLVRRLAAPFAGEPLRLHGADCALQPRAVPQLALILHEWLTNAAKYGALSVPGGRVELETARENGTLRLRWVESGGPPVAGPPARRGFGSLMAEATASGQFGGALEEEWARDGLRLTLRLAAEQVEQPLASAK
jgi:PAS domain S-box-containing protein